MIIDAPHLWGWANLLSLCHLFSFLFRALFAPPAILKDSLMFHSPRCSSSGQSRQWRATTTVTHCPLLASSGIAPVCNLTSVQSLAMKRRLNVMVDLALIVWLSFGCKSFMPPTRTFVHVLPYWLPCEWQKKRSNHFTVDSQGDTMACDVAGVNSYTVCCGVSSWICTLLFILSYSAVMCLQVLGLVFFFNTWLVSPRKSQAL